MLSFLSHRVQDEDVEEGSLLLRGESFLDQPLVVRSSSSASESRGRRGLKAALSCDLPTQVNTLCQVQYLTDYFFNTLGKAFPEPVRVACLGNCRPDRKEALGLLKAISPEEMRHAMLLAIARDIKKELDVSEWRTSCLSVIFTFAHVDNEDMLFTQAANERESVGARYESIYYTGALASESRARSEKRCLLSSL
jgi:hypothetical protein